MKLSIFAVLVSQALVAGSFDILISFTFGVGEFVMRPDPISAMGGGDDDGEWSGFGDDWWRCSGGIIEAVVDDDDDDELVRPKQRNRQASWRRLNLACFRHLARRFWNHT